MPLIRQMPKTRGFKSKFPKNLPVSLSDLDRAFQNGDVIDPKALIKKGLINEPGLPIKILAKGGLSKRLQIKNLKLSGAAKAAIEKAGGSIIDKDTP